ncbi:putative ionotropic receptor IR8a, partial [Operophtera brumata]
MTVLRTEVWLSIVAALVLTGSMIWLLDKEFTLKESFWFALTSFTPQGGGEAPKALSGRTLVAAYWLFVTPVSSLEQLARQSRINYTVVEASTIHQYFINMKFAEDTLY